MTLALVKDEYWPGIIVLFFQKKKCSVLILTGNIPFIGAMAVYFDGDQNWKGSIFIMNHFGKLAMSVSQRSYKRLPVSRHGSRPVGSGMLLSTF